MTFYDRMRIVCFVDFKGNRSYLRANRHALRHAQKLTASRLRPAGKSGWKRHPRFSYCKQQGGTQRCGALSCPGFTAHSACGGRYPYRLEWKVPACKPEAIRMENNAEGCRTLRKKFFPSGRDLPGTITRTDCRFKAPFRPLAQRNGTYRYAPAPAV